MKALIPYMRILIAIWLSALLYACGGSSGDDTVAGIGGTGITQGRITGFGSIFVNGTKFDTNMSQFDVDGNTSANEANLSVGMVVKITGSVDSNGLTGTADQVVYDDEIQGPIATITAAVDGKRTATVFNKTIVIDETTTNFDDSNFAGLSMNDIIEVSGFDATATTINATFIKKIGTYPAKTEIELKGTISNFSVNSFELAGAIVTTDGDTEIKVPGGSLSNGLFVEVKGDLTSLTTILAEEIELEEDDFKDGEDVSLQGVISQFTDISDFIVSGQQVNASNASLSPASATLADGINVEVEGEIVNGVLIAEEVELREGEVEIKAFVQSVDVTNKQFNYGFLPAVIGAITITTDNQTSFEDEVGGASNFSLDQIMPGYFVKIEGIDTGTEIIANQVKRLDPVGEDTELQGKVDTFIPLSSITIFGITFDVNVMTNIIGGTPAPGDHVEIVDNDPADGIIDEIEKE